MSNDNNDNEPNSTRHYGAVLLAIAALSTLSLISAGRIVDAVRSTEPASAESAFTEADEWQVSLNSTL